MKEKERYTLLWRMNCEQLAGYDEAIALKDDELMALQKRVKILEVRPTRESPGESGTGDKGVVGVTGHAGRAVPGGAVVPVLDPGRDHTHSSPFTPTEERERGVRRTHAIGGLRTIGGSGRTDAGPSKHSTPTIGEPHDGSMRRGKAPPIDAFDGESPDVLFEDWLPGLQRAAQWNGWSKDETLIQLAGHLRGRALQEWGLLSAREQESLEEATIALRSRLEPSSRALAAQDFRHASQRDKESVADFIRRLEQLFKLAYGREGMSDETRGTLLHSQLQEGLRYDIMEAPAVSGSHDYRELCLASRNEEKRLVELAKRRQYTKSPQQLPPRQTPLPPANQMRRDQVERPRPQGPYSRRPDGDRSGAPRRCYNCDQLGHMSWECPSRRTESTGRGTAARSREAGTKQVRTAGGRAPSRGEEYSPVGLGAFSCLLSSDSEDEEDGVRLVRISDQGSEQQHADVLIEGVPAKGVIDSGAEITIIGGKLFARIAAVARLKKSRLKASDKIPKTYDRRSFTLDGRIDLDVCFNGIEMRTPVYIKLDAPEQLLIAEGVCRQLGIIKYHPSIVDEKHRSKDGAKRWKRSQNRDQDYPAEGKRCKVSGGEVQEGRRRKVSGGEVQEGRRRKVSGGEVQEGRRRKVSGGEVQEGRRCKVSGGEVLEGENSGGESPGGVAETTTTLTQTMTEDMDYAIVPMVRVRLVTALRVPPHQFVFAKVRVDGDYAHSDPLLFQHQEAVEESLGVCAGDALVHLNEDCTSQIFLMNTTGFTRRLEEGEVVGEAVPAVVVNPSGDEVSRAFTISAVTQAELAGEANTREAERRKKLIEELKEPDLPSPEREILLDFLAAHNHAFSLSDNERGETDLVQMEIDTGDAYPKKQPTRRVPFALRQEVARQLEKMQENGVIQPSISPWASPVVLVKKRDGTHRFCVDYRRLNSVTKPDSFPLPRIEDLLDQLGRCTYFSTIDLASGFWQIRMDPASQEKTAFTTQRGLFEFRVMPFGLTNAPAVFQRLMQQIVVPLNPSAGPDFVSVYLDDILVFSRTLKEHMVHLKTVVEKLAENGLKLKPAKCQFAQRELLYLGHVVSREGLKTNPRVIDAVRRFPVPKSVQETRRFLGLSSYYRKFIPNFARIARPLHQLTCRNAHFVWSQECQQAFGELQQRLITSPVLSYPDFTREFVLETDASVVGIGAVLGQRQDDNKVHPVAYASRALTTAESHYSITELETLAVVWAISHFHHYLYGNTVTVYTDHTAVKSVLEMPNPSGKHARWWIRVYGRGVKEVRIVYRAGRENKNADALSRNPVSPAPDVGIAENEVQVSPVGVTEVGNSQSANHHATTEVSISGPDVAVGELTDSAHLRANHDQYSVQGVDAPLQVPGAEGGSDLVLFACEQKKDGDVKEIIDFAEKGILPEDSTKARKVALQESLFTIVEGILYFIDSRHQNQKRAVVPQHLRTKILQETHSSFYGGHFSGQRLYNSLRTRWWWRGMFNDALRFAKACPECAIATGTGRRIKPPLHPIPVSRPFQILAIDVMDLPPTERGNKHVVVIQDLFTKWPFVFAVPDQKTDRIARLIAEEVVPCFGVPECLLSDRGTNLVSKLMMDLCKILGITKLSTTAYHPQCDGAVERFNRTLKSILRKHAARFGCQWDRFLPGVLWAYRNTPHTSTGEKPSFLLYGVDCRSPTEAAYLPPEEVYHTDVEDYREELMLTLSSARQLAASRIQRAQMKYKEQYDRKAKETTLRIGDWVLIRFPQDESGRWRKLCRPWHGPYRVTDRTDPDVTCVKVYHPQEDTICVHQSRVCRCPDGFPAGYYWYGGRRKGPGRPPKWVELLLQSGSSLDAVAGEEPAHQHHTDPIAMDTHRDQVPARGKEGDPIQGEELTQEEEGDAAQERKSLRDSSQQDFVLERDSTAGSSLPQGDPMERSVRSQGGNDTDHRDDQDFLDLEDSLQPEEVLSQDLAWVPSSYMEEAITRKNTEWNRPKSNRRLRSQVRTPDRLM